MPRAGSDDAERLYRLGTQSEASFAPVDDPARRARARSSGTRRRPTRTTSSRSRRSSRAGRPGPATGRGTCAGWRSWPTTTGGSRRRRGGDAGRCGRRARTARATRTCVARSRAISRPRSRLIRRTGRTCGTSAAVGACRVTPTGAEQASVTRSRSSPISSRRSTISGCSRPDAAPRHSALDRLRLAASLDPAYDLAAWNLGVLESSQGPGASSMGRHGFARRSGATRIFGRGPVGYITDERIYRVSADAASRTADPRLHECAGGRRGRLRSIVARSAV